MELDKKETTELELERERFPFEEEEIPAETRRQARKRRMREEKQPKTTTGHHHLHKPTRKMNKTGLFAALIILVGFIAGLGVGAAGSKLMHRMKSSGEDDVLVSGVSKEQERLDGIKWAFSIGANILETLRKYYPDDIVMYKSGKYVFEAIDPSLKMHTFDSEKVRKNTDGTWGYVDGDRKVLKGIDVSSHQGEIDWGKVAYTNVQFAVIRAMYRGYESGKLMEDKQFRYNIENAKEKGIKVGVYVFTQAMSTKEADEEINMLSGLLGAYDLDLPVVVDVEAVGNGSARMDKLSKEERTEIIKYYCEKLEKAGYTPMIYYNIDGAVNMVDVSRLEAYEKWFAVYDSDFYYPYAYTMWQYSEKGKVDGIEGYVDFDLYFPEG